MNKREELLSTIYEIIKEARGDKSIIHKIEDYADHIEKLFDDDKPYAQLDNKKENLAKYLYNSWHNGYGPWDDIREDIKSAYRKHADEIIEIVQCGDTARPGPPPADDEYGPVNLGEPDQISNGPLTLDQRIQQLEERVAKLEGKNRPEHPRPVTWR